MTNEQYECVIADLTKQINEQNARIAELEAENSKLKRIRAFLGDQLQKEIMQTISLEAALKPFEEKSSKSLADAEKLAANEGYELPDDQTAEDIYAWALALTWGDLRAASAALKGEK